MKPFRIPDSVHVTYRATGLTLRQLVRKHDGWFEGSVARFPTVWDRQQFEREYHEKF